jgi:hypothetical protein
MRKASMARQAADAAINLQTNADYVAHETEGNAKRTIFALFQGKLQTTEHLMSLLSTRLHCIRTSIIKAKRSLEDVIQAMRSKQKPLQFCSYRLNLRKSRLPPNWSNDSFQAALASEKGTLEDAKALLVVRQTQTVGMLQQLKDCERNLEADLTTKQNAQRIDRECLKEQTVPANVPVAVIAKVGVTRHSRLTRLLVARAQGRRTRDVTRRPSLKSRPTPRPRVATRKIGSLRRCS